MKRARIAVILGTRPEAVKLATIILEMSKSKKIYPLIISTNQHQQMVKQILRSFGIKPDVQLHVMLPNQSLYGLSARLILRLSRIFEKHKIKAALVQGDTTSAFFGALASFYHQTPVGHVEAGLRSGNPYSPFPEEMNRRLISQLTRWHFAPTADAVQNLIRDGIPKSNIFMTGNPVVDSLKKMNSKISKKAGLKKLLGPLDPQKPYLLVTCHRRENFGNPMKNIGRAIATLARKNPNLSILFPMHLNPKVRNILTPILTPLPNIHICPPLDYEPFLLALKYCRFILSDSGGVQEEAAAMGKPVLVLRNETERMEGVRAGTLKLVGTDSRRILRESQRLLQNPAAYRKMQRASKVFGDGKSAKRIVRILEQSVDPI